jgi:thiosulfate dehydrogenase
MNLRIKLNNPLTIVLTTLIFLVVLTLAFQFYDELEFVKQKAQSTKLLKPTIEKIIQPFHVPEISSVPKDQFGASVLRGKDYLEHTFEKLPQFVGAKINCTSCHLNSGTTQFAGPWVGVVARFPQYRSRSGKMDTLEDRVNDCFERSLNGSRLPENSQEMTDIISYMTWLSTGYAKGNDVEGSGMPKIVMSRLPDLKAGKVVYESKCNSCHQSNGQGLYAITGQVAFPALWGPKSFNLGAGMARLHTAAGFVKKNMPLGQGGTLTDDEAWDVAAYFSQQIRPDFKNKLKDWPKGDRPKDARY